MMSSDRRSVPTMWVPHLPEDIFQLWSMMTLHSWLFAVCHSIVSSPNLPQTDPTRRQYNSSAINIAHCLAILCTPPPPSPPSPSSRVISYEWVFKHYDSLYRNCIFQYILKEKHQKTLGCNTSIWFVATESKAFWSFVRTRWCLSQSHTCHNLKDKKSSFDTFSKILPLLRPEFFTARCKIGWDWINLERCYSPKLSVAARIIGYLWSIKIILIFSDATEEERA